MNYKTLIARTLAALKSDHLIAVTGTSEGIAEAVAKDMAPVFKREHISKPTAGVPGHNRFTVYLANDPEDWAFDNPDKPPHVFSTPEANVIAYELVDVIKLHERNAFLEQSVNVHRSYQMADDLYTAGYDDNRREKDFDPRGHDAWVNVVEHMQFRPGQESEKISPNTIVYVATDSKGERVVIGSQGTSDPHGDMSKMLSFLTLDEAVRLRGVEIKNHSLGSLYLNSELPLCDESLRQQSDAWNAIMKVLSELKPEWISGEGTAIQCAVRTIRELGVTGEQ